MAPSWLAASQTPFQAMGEQLRGTGPFQVTGSFPGETTDALTTSSLARGVFEAGRARGGQRCVGTENYFLCRWCNCSAANRPPTKPLREMSHGVQASDTGIRRQVSVDNQSEKQVGSDCTKRRRGPWDVEPEIPLKQPSKPRTGSSGTRTQDRNTAVWDVPEGGWGKPRTRPHVKTHRVLLEVKSEPWRLRRKRAGTGYWKTVPH